MLDEVADFIPGLYAVLLRI